MANKSDTILNGGKIIKHFFKILKNGKNSKIIEKMQKT